MNAPLNRSWLTRNVRLLACSTALLVGALGLVAAGPVRAAEAPPLAANPVLEARMLAITAELRCLVCQNQTVADSHSDLAGDLRQQVREMLERGASNQEVLNFMTARYGDFVLYRPPVKPTTVLLWAGPALLLVGGVSALILTLRRRSQLPPEAFDADEGEAEPAAPAPLASAVTPSAPAAPAA